MPLEQVRSQRRHDRILDAALNVFARRGYREATVDDIALEAETSKGGVYFHFPNKEAIFLALLDQMAALLRSRAETAIATQYDPVAKAETALQVVLHTFGSHRTVARLFLIQALGAGPQFHERMLAIRADFAQLIEQYLDEAVQQGVIPPLDTAIAARMWFGALNEVVTHWVLTDTDERLEDTYPTLRAFLLRSVGVEADDTPLPVLPARQHASFG